uniref:Uncharacterized protein n=1 Tax=viral metagenome TaxID=1070528 RepID=A0A6M3LFX9_9ZZZZ
MKKRNIIYEKTKSGSYLHNCYVKRRVDDLSTTLFSNDDKVVNFCLNGYAIVPLEEVRALYTDIIIEEENVKEADRQVALL